MALLPRVAPGEPLPPTELALDYPNGLLAVCDDLSVERLLEAYGRGIFPWFEDPQPALWWAPDPRFVLEPADLHVSRSLRRRLRQNRHRLSVDTDFGAVMRACAEPRPGQDGTWINRRMLDAYGALHEAGFAHSVEVRDLEGALVGGLYGVALGRAFFGESMFSRQSDASKIALVALVHLLSATGFELIDCQQQTEHLERLGARPWPRLDFERRLAQTVRREPVRSSWRVPEYCGDLL